MLGIDYTITDQGWVVARIESEHYRLDPKPFISMRAALMTHFAQDFTAADEKDRREVSGSFLKWYEENKDRLKIQSSQKITEQLDYNEQFDAIVEETISTLHCVSEGTRGELIYCYDEGKHVYSENGEQIAKAFLQRLIKDCRGGKVGEILGAVRRKTFRRPSDLVEGVNLETHISNPHLVLENGMYNLDTMQFEEFNEASADYFITNHMPVKFHPDAKCPKWEKFLSECLPLDDILILQEALGAILRKCYLTRKFLIFQGPPATGKTTTLNVFTMVQGEENVSNISMQRLGKGDKFTLGPIHNKTSNIGDEVPPDAVRSIDIIKQLTGRSRIQAERKFGHEFSFENYAFLMFACNILPPISVDEEAFWDRLIMIDFKNVVPPDKRNPELLDDLKSELSGILNWGIEGLKRLQKQNWHFSRNESIEDVREKYIQRSEPLSDFISKYVEDGTKEDFIFHSQFHSRFFDHCQKIGILPWSKTRIAREITKYLKNLESRHAGEKGKQERAWFGIKWKSLAQEDDHSFVHMSPSELGFGADCEYCGRGSCASYRNRENRLACKECALSA